MINLNNAKPGDKLLTRHGAIAVYIQKRDDIRTKLWPHEIMFLDGTIEHNGEVHNLKGTFGSRTDDGYVMFNEGSRLPADHDIVEILGRY